MIPQRPLITGLAGVSLLSLLVGLALAGTAAVLIATQFAQLSNVTQGTSIRDRKISLRKFVRQRRAVPLR